MTTLTGLALYMLLGVILSRAGIRPSSWQYWAIAGTVAAIDVLRYTSGIRSGRRRDHDT